MPAATDAQMQQFANERLRPFAERLRGVFAAAADHKAAIDDVYARAVSNSRWTDSRTDGPPHLLMSGNSANPDDMLQFNDLLTHLLHLRDGTFPDLATANAFAARWAVIQDACVRPLID